MIQAIIDVGSNTIRMAIYNIESDKSKPSIELLMKKKNLVGLAAYVENGFMKTEGVEVVCKVLKSYKKLLDNLKIENIEAFTTAALRNCCNSKDVLQEIIARTGIPLRVVSGDEEAELGFIGATHNSDSASGLLVDLGGGSTELVYYIDKKIINKISLPIGSLNFRNRFVKQLFPNEYEINQMEAEVRNKLSQITEFNGIIQEEICGIGGTFKGIAAIYNVIYEDKENVNGGLLSSKAICKFNRNILDEILQRFAKETLAKDDALVLLRAIPERLETVLPGLIIAKVIAEHFGVKRINYSDSGMREGFIVKSLFQNK